jgi:hypothetical protein
MRMQANRRHIHGRIPTCRTAFYSAPPCHGGVFDSRRWVSRSFPVRTGTRPSGHPEKFCSYTLSAARRSKSGPASRTITEALTDAHRPTARSTSLTAKEIDFFESDRCAFRRTSTSASGWAYLNKPPMTEAKKITTPSKSNPVTIFLFRMRRAAGLRG